MVSNSDLLLFYIYIYENYTILLKLPKLVHLCLFRKKIRGERETQLGVRLRFWASTFIASGVTLPRVPQILRNDNISFRKKKREEDSLLPRYCFFFFREKQRIGRFIIGFAPLSRTPLAFLGHDNRHRVSLFDAMLIYLVWLPPPKSLHLSLDERSVACTGN